MFLIKDTEIVIDILETIIFKIYPFWILFTTVNYEVIMELNWFFGLIQENEPSTWIDYKTSTIWVIFSIRQPIFSIRILIHQLNQVKNYQRKYSGDISCLRSAQDNIIKENCQFLRTNSGTAIQTCLKISLVSCILLDKATKK